MYGLPVTPSSLDRLGAVVHALSEGAVGVFVDHPDQILRINALAEQTWPGQVPVWVQIDVGYHREGIPAESRQLAELALAIKSSEKARLAGFYSHMGHSYGVGSPTEALDYALTELSRLEEGARSFMNLANLQLPEKKIMLSMGATPTATSLQGISEESKHHYQAHFDKIKLDFDVELHAGVYPVLDLQQLATRARPAMRPVVRDSTRDAHPEKFEHLLSYHNMGLRILVEVASTYIDRGDAPEALIAAGGIVLGREPCKSYPGWGVVTPWPEKLAQDSEQAPVGFYDPNGEKTGWIVGRISQEHGILVWHGSRASMRPLRVGEKLLVWPNHACIAGVNFGWYVVVDSDEQHGDRIVDVWTRWRGW